MKKYNILILVLFSWCLVGCSDYLDQDPEELNTLEKVFSKYTGYPQVVCAYL